MRLLFFTLKESGTENAAVVTKFFTSLSLYEIALYMNKISLIPTNNAAVTTDLNFQQLLVLLVTS